MDDRVAAVEHALQARAVEEIDALVAHLGSLLAELARDVAPEEASGPRDVDLQARAALRRPSAMTGQYVRYRW